MLAAQGGHLVLLDLVKEPSTHTMVANITEKVILFPNSQSRLNRFTVCQFQVRSRIDLIIKVPIQLGFFSKYTGL